MAEPSKKSDKRVQSTQIGMRVTADVKAFLEAAAAQEQARLIAERPGAKLGLKNFVEGAAVEAAAEVLGMSLADWLKKQKRRTP